jgi:hypothetical protein
MEDELITGLIRLQSVGLYERLRRVRFYVDNMVDHAARIERFLWPGGRGDQQRGSAVRRRIGIDDASPLRERIRGLRDRWQHLDERLDRHFATPRPATDDENEEGASPTGFGVSRDPGLTVRVQGERVELEPVIDEVRILLARCQLARKTIDRPELAEFYRMQLEE